MATTSAVLRDSPPPTGLSHRGEGDPVLGRSTTVLVACAFWLGAECVRRGEDDMTKGKNKKRVVRERMAATGESYQAAHHALIRPARFLLVHEGRRHVLGEQAFTIGRMKECSLVLDDSLVSRKHASVYVRGGQLIVEDHASRNGVIVNGTKVHQRAFLEGGDAVLIGKTTLAVVDSDADAPAGDPRELWIGSVIADRFNVLEVVPSNEPFIVYEAEHVVLGGRVHLKLLPNQDEHLRARLLREGRTLQRLSHLQVPRVFDISETPRGDTYLALEPVPRTTLAGRALDERRVLDVARQLADILRHLDEKGVAHRALCEDVVHVEERGDTLSVKLASFSLAKLEGERPLLIPEGIVLTSDLQALGRMLMRLLGDRPSSLEPICDRLIADDRTALVELIGRPIESRRSSPR